MHMDSDMFQPSLLQKLQDKVTAFWKAITAVVLTVALGKFLKGRIAMRFQKSWWTYFKPISSPIYPVFGFVSLACWTTIMAMFEIFMLYKYYEPYSAVNFWVHASALIFQSIIFVGNALSADGLLEHIRVAYHRPATH